MSKFVKNVIIFIAIALIIAIVYIIIKLIRKFIIIKDGFQIVWFNSHKCGQKRCPSTSPIPNFPEINVTEWRVDIAKYVAELIYRIEIAAQDKVKIEYLPEIIVHKELYNDSRDPVFGSVMESDGIIFIGFRGTLTSREFTHDLDIQQEKYLNNKSLEQVKFELPGHDDTPLVHRGFMDVYKNVKKDLEDTLEKINSNKDKPIIIFGHSLGAAIATISGVDLFHKNYSIVVYNYASPKIGNQSLCDIIDDSINVFRVVNTSDIVPNLPAAVSPNFKDINNPYIYSHCGVLKSFNDNWLSTLNNHLIPVYMKGLETM